MKSSNGKITAEVAAVGGRTEITTSNGSIDLYICPELDLEIEARTSNGSINVIGLKITARTMDSKLLRGDLGEGGNLLQIKTSNGSVTVQDLR